MGVKLGRTHWGSNDG